MSVFLARSQALTRYDTTFLSVKGGERSSFSCPSSLALATASAKASSAAHITGVKVKKQISCQGKTDNGNETKTDPNCPAFSPPLPLRLAALKAPLTDATENCSTKCSVGMKRPPNRPVCPEIRVWENYICILAYVYDGSVCFNSNAGNGCYGQNLHLFLCLWPRGPVSLR